MKKIHNFYEYLKILESTQSVLSESELSGIIDEIAKGWTEILENSESDGLPDFLKERPKDTGKAREIISSGEIDNEAKGIVPRIANAVVFWTKQKEKNKEIVEKFLSALEKKVGPNLEKTNYDSVESLNSDIEKTLKRTGINYLSNVPYISLIKSEEIKSAPSTEEKSSSPEAPKYISLSQDNENIEFFKDNQYDATKDVNLQEEDASKVKSMIDEIVNALKGGAELRRLVIKTSASRFRNTGAVENLSWAGLSYLRSSSLALYIINYLRDKGFDDEQISKINSLISLEPQGENGDGTSGPNPPDVRFGFYDSDNNFIEGKTRDDVTIKNVNWGSASINVAKIGGIVDQTTPGLPQISGDGKDVKMPVLSSKDDYEKFKYVNIIAEIVTKEGSPNSQEPVVLIKGSSDPKLEGLALKINLPSKFFQEKYQASKGGSFKIFKPIRIGSSPKSSIGKTLKCPKF